VELDPKEIYANLKEKIIWLDLKPGSTLNLVELAESFGVSRNPITIALTKLEVEEWVIRQGSHFVVSPLTVDRIREITEIRSVLEVQANLWAMHRITPEELVALKSLGDEINNVDEQTTNREIVKLDVKFHSILYKASKNSQLAIMLDRMLCHYLRFWLSINRTIDKNSFFNQAFEIIKAIEDKDEVRLHAASVEHIRISLDKIMGMSPSNFQPKL
jgi:DNA-binding GntR family transcriptional regulator